MTKLNVAVIMGGRSEEREISLSTGRAILAALDPNKYNAFPVDSAHVGPKALEPAKPTIPGADGDSTTSLELVPLDHIVHPNGSHPNPDVVFIALHGKYGEDGTIQGLLELLEIPYVGSGVLASALAMDKIMARKVLEYEGIAVPRAVTARRDADITGVIQEVERDLGYPVIVKPNEQGSTIGMTVVRRREELAPAVGLAGRYDKDILIEDFIEGTEITAGVLGNEEAEVLPLIEIVPSSGFYDYHAKYTPGATEKIVPPRIPKSQYRMAVDFARRSHRALGCRGMSRVDMMAAPDQVYVLEVNTIPGMTPTSLLPRAAQVAGIEFPELVDRLIGFALEGK